MIFRCRFMFEFPTLDKVTSGSVLLKIPRSFQSRKGHNVDYHLVKIQKKTWNGISQFVMSKSNYKWQFSMAMLVYQRVIFWKSCAVHLPNMNNMDYLGMFTYVFAVLVRLWPITSQNQTGMCQNDSKCVKLAKICGLSLILDFLDSVPSWLLSRPVCGSGESIPMDSTFFGDIMIYCIYIYDTHCLHTFIYPRRPPYVSTISYCRCHTMCFQIIKIYQYIHNNFS